jgi:hypothetical protein
MEILGIFVALATLALAAWAGGADSRLYGRDEPRRSL